MISVFIFFILNLTYHSIPLNGDLSGFSNDELVYKDSPYDSYWQGNELYGLYLTWDRNNLYIGLSYKVQNNAVLLVIDPGRDRGVNDINNLDWYPRNFQFYGMSADILCALWNADLSTGGVREILAKDRTQVLSGVEIINNGKPGDSSALMLKIPFSVLYGTDYIPSGTTLKLVALISGSDHAGGADAIPDNENLGSSSAVRTFIEIPLDRDMDSVPDDSVHVNEAMRVITYPKRVLKLSEFTINPLKLDNGLPLTIKFKVTDYSFAKLYIMSENGKRIYEQLFESLTPDKLNTLTWIPPNYLNQGIYFVVIDLNDIIREKKAFYLKK